MISKKFRLPIDDSPELSSNAAMSLTFEEMDLQWDSGRNCFVMGLKRRK